MIFRKITDKDKRLWDHRKQPYIKLAKEYVQNEMQRRNIKLFLLLPRSLKLNGGVERTHRTHTEENQRKEVVCH